MFATLNAITPVFLIIATGYLLFRFRVVNESVWSAIEHICFYLLMPALIIRTLSRANLGSVPVVDFTLRLPRGSVGFFAATGETTHALCTPLPHPTAARAAEVVANSMLSAGVSISDYRPAN